MSRSTNQTHAEGNTSRAPRLNLATCRKIGFIVPSSNTAVEPITTSIFSSVDRQRVICLFTRLRVQTLGTDDASTSQFSPQNVIAAASLLTDAKVDAVIWNGTSGMWMSPTLTDEEQFAKDVEEAIGVPFTTTTLATIRALDEMGASKISIAVPYSVELTTILVDFFAGVQREIVRAERLHSAPLDNVEIAKTSAHEIREVVRRCVDAETQAIVVACTNWPASIMVEELEEELGVPIVDSIIVTAWIALRMLQYDEGIQGWGRLMKNLQTVE